MKPKKKKPFSYLVINPCYITPCFITNILSPHVLLIHVLTLQVLLIHGLLIQAKSSPCDAMANSEKEVTVMEL